MGLFSSIKNAFLFNKMLKQSIREEQEKDERYSKMISEEIKNLPDNELCDAVIRRIFCKADEYDEYEILAELTDTEFTVYVISIFNMEFENGGLCQFFENSSKSVAPYISKRLEIIGANDHKELYNSFVIKYDFDLNNLSEFETDDIDEFVDFYEKYDFEEFDNAFSKLPPLMDYLNKYILSNRCNF